MFEDYIKGRRSSERLDGDIYSHSIRHAYIFEGERGIGKRSAALRFAAMAQCEGEKKPCGVCRSCMMHKSGTHPDFAESDGAGMKKEDARSLVAALYIKPFSSDKKIYFINNADDLSVEVQNLLLKALEEPPSYGVFILSAAEASNLIATVRSRCSVVSFDALDEGDIREYIAKKYPEADADFVSRVSGGNIGKAIEMCESGDELSRREAVFDALMLLLDAKKCVFDAKDAMLGQSKSPEDDSRAALTLAMTFMRDVLAKKSGEGVINTDYEKKIGDFARRITLDGALRSVDIISDTLAHLKKGMQYDLWVLDMLISLWEEVHGTGSWRKIQA